MVYNRKIVALILVFILVFTMGISGCKKTENESGDFSSASLPVSSESAPSPSSEAEVSSEDNSSLEQPVESKPQQIVTPDPKPPVSAPVVTVPSGEYKYNTNIDIENNIFLDSMIYTGYNINKHRSDGLMWVYILASQKRAKGWLSNIGYGGGCTGYETTVDGKPNIARFEKGGLVCASYLTYVYFNYLPNVAGIDTSSLTRPDDPHLANSWYNAAKDWVNKGYSYEIPYTASMNGHYIRFTPSVDIPIGSIMVYQDFKNRNGRGSHVALYAGYKNGYHWVYHVGNENGPEFCAVERMSCGPDPQWPLAVISTPTSIRMTASLEISLKDDEGQAISGAEFSLKNSAGVVTSIGKTDTQGKLIKEGLSYGEYELMQAVPQGYSSDKATQNIKLITANNSYNRFDLINTKIKSAESDNQSEATNDKVPDAQ